MADLTHMEEYDYVSTNPLDHAYRECPHCGWCEYPDHCVFSIACPECEAPPGIGYEGQCRDAAAGGRYIKLHAARWQAVHDSRIAAGLPGIEFGFIQHAKEQT